MKIFNDMLKNLRDCLTLEERIQKIIAEFGFCSRRKAEILIKNKLVRCNGRIVKLGQKATVHDDITIDGEKLEVDLSRKFKYVMLNKPRGFLSSVFFVVFGFSSAFLVLFR